MDNKPSARRAGTPGRIVVERIQKALFSDRGSQVIQQSHPVQTVTSQRVRITVCICTFKRGELLARCLRDIGRQRSDGLFTFSIVVVDNDSAGSALPTIKAFREQSGIEVNYFIEPRQNISLARNKAVENATGDYLALIDDDEFPHEEWLLTLYKTCVGFGCDGVLGPVRPHYGEGCPKWLVKSDLCERPAHLTGRVLHGNETRTGNVLLKRAVIDDPDNRFDPRYGRTGGEDVSFFTKLIANGGVLVWCAEAPVFEVVPPERWTVSYHLRRSLRIGKVSGGRKREGLPGMKVPVAVAAFTVHAMIVPFGVLLGRHVLVKHLVKSAYYVSWLSGYLRRGGNSEYHDRR